MIKEFFKKLTTKGSALGSQSTVQHDSICKKVAFTLAEVLITLAIIGVVAALTLPNLMYKIEVNALHSQFKQAYAEFNQISKKFMVDHDISIPQYGVLYGQAGAMDEMKKYIKGLEKISDWKYDKTIDDMPYYVKDFAGETRNMFGVCDNLGLFSDVRGRIISFDDSPNADGWNGPPVCIDTNGSKKPNVYGIDIFTFVFMQDGRVLPIEDPKAQPVMFNSHAENFTNCFESKGRHCGTYALSDKNPNGDGTSYWNDFILKKQYKNISY